MIPNTKKIYLCSPDRKPLFVLNGVKTDTVDYHTLVKAYSELSFTVDRFIVIDGKQIESNGYEDLKPYMYLYLEDIGYFQMQAPIVNNDGNNETKDIEALSAEKEFENKDWKGLKINTGQTDSVEYLYADNIDNLGFAKRYVVMYDLADPRFSFLDMVLEKVSYWKVGHVDASVKNLRIPSLDIDNENLYAVMTTEVAPRLQCLFIFDFLNFEINVYNKDSIDYDTGIFIGFRNLATSIGISVDQDSIYTRFTVAGADDLNIRYYNYGRNEIYNLDYFLGEPYMDEELAQKIKDFNEFRDKYREDYVEVAKDAVALRDKLYDLKYTVPADNLYWKNWDNMNEEGLQENLKYYNSMLESFQIACDERPNDVKFGGDEYLINWLKNEDNLLIVHDTIESKTDTETADILIDIFKKYNSGVFGNIDLNNRQIIEWTNENLTKYNQKLTEYEYYVEEGSYSTTLINSHTYKINNDTSVTIVYSPLMQTNDDEPILLSKSAVQSYLNDIIINSYIDGEFLPDNVLTLDKIGADNIWADEVETISNLVSYVAYGEHEDCAEIVENIIPLYEDGQHIESTNIILSYADLSLDNFDTGNIENGEYLPVRNMFGQVDHDYYLQILKDNMGKYSGYYTYKEIVEYIIPYIELALMNMGEIEDEKRTPEDIGIGDATENWELYGYEELDGVRKSYEEDMLTKLDRYSKNWDELTEEEIEEYSLNYVSEEEYENSFQRKQYLHYKECLGDKDNPQDGTIYKRLQDLQHQMDDILSQLDVLNKTLGDYNNIMLYDITNTTDYEDADGNWVVYSNLDQEIIDERTELLFTLDEINLITALFHDTDYTNSNILTTTLDTEYQIIDREKELYQDASDKLVEVSLPQYTFSVSLDNMLRISNYEQWYGDFKLLRFIRLGIRDDYSVKLRIIGYRWNPCEITPDLQLEFSNMITSKSGRSDLVLLLELENNVGSKNSISIGTGNSKSDQEYIASLVNVLAKNSIFTKLVQNIAGGVTGQTDLALVLNIVSDYVSTLHLNADSINVGNITGDEGLFKQLFTKYLQSDVIYTKLVDAEQGKIKDLTAEVLRVGSENDENGENGFTDIIGGYINTHEISADNISVTEGFVSDVLTVGTDTITSIAGGLITTEKVLAELVKATDAQIENLSAKVITVGENSITSIAEGVITTATINADNINVTEAFVSDVLTVGTSGITSIANDTLTTDTVVARLADVDELQARQVSAAIVTADSVIAGLVNAEEGQFENLTAENAFMQYLSANLITASEIDVDDLKAKMATIDVATIQDLSADNAFINSLQTLASSSATSVINDAYIYNAVANKIAVSDLAAGNITLTDNMLILSENGKMIMNGTALQILGKDKNGNDYIGIQLGYDTSENPSLILRNESGATVLTPEGITSEAIADQLIINNMIKDGTISEDKLGFNIMKEGDTVTVELIMLGNKQFGAEWSSFTTNTNTALNNLNNDVDEINSKKMYRTVIESNNGNIFKNGDVNCILSCRVFSWDDDITDDINSANFIWTRLSKNEAQDRLWNANHSGGTKTLTITPADVWGRSVFYCTVTLPDGSSITNG